jgi:hypothetical protein
LKVILTPSDLFAFPHEFLNHLDHFYFQSSLLTCEHSLPLLWFISLTSVLQCSRNRPYTSLPDVLCIFHILMLLWYHLLNSISDSLLLILYVEALEFLNIDLITLLKSLFSSLRSFYRCQRIFTNKINVMQK